MKIGIFGNPQKAIVGEALGELRKHVRDDELIFEEALERYLNPDDRRLPQERIAEEVDYILSFGGDGTLLRATRFSKGTPIAGINLGGLGFLTIYKVEELKNLLNALRNGRFELEERMALNVTLSKTKRVFFALNDVTVTITGSSRMIHITIEAGGETLSRYMADGVIVATPTGSTAYNLAAGGPVVHPQMEAVIITPICAHTLSVRPVILPSTYAISIIPSSKGEKILFSADGQDQMVIHHEARVEIKAQEKAVKLIKLLDSPGFFTLLHKKLGWG